MLKSFFSLPNIFVRLLVILVFAGGLVFAGTFDGFVPKTQTQSGCSGTDVTTTEKPVAQTEASGCGCSGTDVLLADGTAGQPEIRLSDAKKINNTLVEQSKANTAAACGCGYNSCPTDNCSNGCNDVPGCEDSCNCSKTRCAARHCSSYGHCGKKVKPRGCDGSAPSTSS